MIKTEYSSLIEAFPYHKFEQHMGIDMPHVLIDCYTAFYNEFDRNEVCEAIKQNPKLKGKTIYLPTVGRVVGTEKIRNYYKLWKGMSKQWNLDMFQLGAEYQIMVNGECFFCGIAEIQKNQLYRAIDILYQKQQTCFLWFSKNKIDISQYATMHFFSDIIGNNRCKNTNFIFDYLALYNKIGMGDCIVTISLDGEEISIFIGKKS